MPLLLREAIGESLRHARVNQSKTLKDVSRRAKVSLGYLSEIERGQKEVSSELLEAICSSLGITLPLLLEQASMTIRADELARADKALDGKFLGGKAPGSDDRFNSSARKQTSRKQVLRTGHPVADRTRVRRSNHNAAAKREALAAA